MKRKELSLEQIEFLLRCVKGTYVLDEVTGKVNVQGNVEMKGLSLSMRRKLFHFPVEFGIVNGYFSCRGLKNLRSLKGCPTTLNGSFDCSYCDSITSLEGVPVMKGNWLTCEHCKSLVSLKGAEDSVVHWFDCSGCYALESLEHSPKAATVYKCGSCRSLKTLKGITQDVSHRFYCGYCTELETLEGAPPNFTQPFELPRCNKVPKEEKEIMKYPILRSLWLNSGMKLDEFRKRRYGQIKGAKFGA